MKLSREEVQHIAILARVGMTEEDLERFREQLSNILEHFEVLRQLDTEGVPPTGHAIPLQNVFRDDTAQASFPQDQVLANAPEAEGDYFRVRAVLEF